MRLSKLLPLIALLIVLTHIITLQPISVKAEGSNFKVILVTWGSPASPTEVGPGDSAQLTILLESTTSIPSANIIAYLELPKGLASVSNGSKAVTYYTSTRTSIPAGSVVELQFPLKVLQNSTTGVYKAKLILEYLYQVYTYVRTYTEEHYVDILVSGKPSLKITLLNTSTYPGTQEIVFRVINDGSALAHDISLELLSQPTIFTNITRVEVDTLKVGEEITIPVKINVPTSLSGNVITLTTYLTYSRNCI